MGTLPRLLALLLLALVAAPAYAVPEADTATPAVEVVGLDAGAASGSSTDTSTETASTDAETMRAEFTGLEAFAGFLDGVERRVADPSPLTRRIAEHGRSSTVKRIKDGRDVDGDRLAPNAESTVARKGSSKPLVDDADFLGSQSVDSGPDHAAWGSNLPYAAAITAGTDRAGRGNSVTLPERQVYGLDDQDEAELDRLALDFIAGDL